MKDNYQKIQTTFGQIKIYKDTEDVIKKKDQNESKQENFSIKEIQSKKSEIVDDGNFYGIEDTNFFDKKMLDEYKINNELQKSNKTSDEKIAVSIEKLDKNELNFIDGIYFENLTEQSSNSKYLY